MFTKTDFKAGDRVRSTNYSPVNQAATFLRYSDRGACPDTHISTPGMRLAEIDSDRFGRHHVWEIDLAPA